MLFQVICGPAGSASEALGVNVAKSLPGEWGDVQLSREQSGDPNKLQILHPDRFSSPIGARSVKWDVCIGSHDTLTLRQESETGIVRAILKTLSGFDTLATEYVLPVISPDSNVQALVPEDEVDELSIVKSAWQALTHAQKGRTKIVWGAHEHRGNLRRNLSQRGGRYLPGIRRNTAPHNGNRRGATVIGRFDPITRLQLCTNSLRSGKPVILLGPASFLEIVLGSYPGVTSCEPSVDSVAYAITQNISDPPSSQNLAMSSLRLTSWLERVHREDLAADMALVFSQEGLASSHPCRACNAPVQWEPEMEAMARGTLRIALAAQWGIEIDQDMQGDPGIIQKFDCEKCGGSTFNAPEGSMSFYQQCHSTPGYQRTAIWDYEAVADLIVQKEAREVLDFGSGVPKLLDLVPHDSINLSLFDIDPKVLETTSSGASGARVLPDLDADALAGTFDVVAMCHVLEHLESPQETLDIMYRIIKPGGFLAITVPTAAWGSRHFSALDWPPHHVTRFSEQALVTIAHQSGFTSSRIIRPPGASGDSYDMMLVCTKPRLR